MLFLSACEQNVNIRVHFFGAEKILHYNIYIKKSFPQDGAFLPQ